MLPQHRSWKTGCIANSETRMAELCLDSCVLVLILMYTQRRDRRLIARAPLVGAGLMGVGLAGYAAWRLLFRPGPLNGADGALLRGVLGAGSGFALPLLVSWLRALFWQDLPRLARALRAGGAWTAGCTLAGLLFAVVYFLYGRQLGLRGVFDHIDGLFDADPLYQQVPGGLPIHTHTHPLLPLIWYLACKPAEALVGTQWAPLAVDSVLGGLCVSLAALYFRAVTRSNTLSLLAALLLGCTTAHLIFAAMPETYIPSAVSLILLHLLVALGGSPALRLRHMVLASVLAAGLTVTNVAAAAICFVSWRGLARRRTESDHRANSARGAGFARWAAYCFLVGSVCLGAQAVFRPGAAPLDPAAYIDETRFVQVDVPVGQRIVSLAHGLFLQNVVGWIPVVGADVGLPGLRAGTRYDGLGLTAAVLWVGSILVAVWTILCSRAWRRRTFVAAAACLAAAAGFYGYYGHESLFLYSCGFTFYLLAMLAHALAPPVHAPMLSAHPAAIPFRGPGSACTGVVAVALTAFLLLLAVNNARFCARILTLL